ncbi:MAG: nitroreductase family protein [Promethearchaeota archaeon]
MEFKEVIKARRSIRNFKEKPVPDEIISEILESARLAPTWANMQGVRHIVVKDPAKVKKISKAIGQKWTERAPCFIIVAISPRDSGKNMNGLEYYPVDAAIHMEHIILAATEKGLGTCWIGYFNEKEVKNILEIPSKIRVIGITPLGYPNEKPNPQKRKPMSEISFRDKWTNPWKV